MGSFKIEDGVLHMPGWIIAAPVVLLLVLFAIHVVVYVVPLAREWPLDAQILGCASLFFTYSGALLFVACLMGWVPPVIHLK